MMRNTLNRKTSFLYFRGDLIHRQPKRGKILDDSVVFELQVSEENYEAAISSIVGVNDTGAFKYDEAVDSSSMINDYFESKADFVCSGCRPDWMLR